MPIYKANPEFSVWCDGCGNLLDYAPFASRAAAVKHFRSLGWSIGKKVKCPECAAPNKAGTGQEPSSEFESKGTGGSCH